MLRRYQPVPRGQPEKALLQIQEEARLEVYDLMGKIVLDKSVPAGAVSFDLSEQAPGMYLLKITNRSGNTAACRIVKN